MPATTTMTSPRARLLSLAACVVSVLMTAACTTPGPAPAAMPAAATAENPLRYRPDQLPYREYWTGIAFNGKKTGMNHVRFAPAEAGYALENEVVLRFYLFGRDKLVKLASRDRIAADLRLLSFEHHYLLDDNELKVNGRVQDDRLHVEVINSAGTHRQTLQPQAPVYPISVTLFYPLYHGIHEGAAYRYLVFDGEAQRLSWVEQKVLGYEFHEDLGMPAYRLQTELYGQLTTSWIGLQGLPLWEQSVNNAFSSTLADESTARLYLEEAARDQDETLLNYSLVKSDRRLHAARQLTRLQVQLLGMGDFALPPAYPRQQCERSDAAGNVTCVISTEIVNAPEHAPRAGDYLEHTPIIPTGHPTMSRLAEDITRGLDGPTSRIRALTAWVHDNIEGEAVDVFTALDVLEKRKAECQGQSFLYTSLARSLNIPTRVVNGLVYYPQLNGFVYHTWAESWDGYAWHSVDPTFGQAPADATHIRLLDGSNVADLSPFMQIMGQIEARILDATP